jgi:peptidoglycan/LPS O-acetylase OafA/YrhL
MKYIPELDGLRAVAVGMVILDHTLNNQFPGGFIGVDIFFVLSGYLITTILAHEFERDERINLGHFYLRRFLRLTPALFILLASYVLVSAAVSGSFREHAKAAFVAATYTMDWAQALKFGPSGFMLHTWSLAVEEQFYLLWPLILIAALRCRISVWKIIVGLILAVTTWRTFLVLHTTSIDPQRIYLSFDTRFDTLLVGCLMAVAPLPWLHKPAARFVMIPILALAVASLTLQWTSHALYLIGFPLIALLAAWLILAAMTANYDGLLRRSLRWGPINYVGRISYGVYLWHMPIALTLFSVLPTQSFVVFALTCILTLIIASASYHWVEQPILKRWRPSARYWPHLSDLQRSR